MKKALSSIVLFAFLTLLMPLAVFLHLPAAAQDSSFPSAGTIRADSQSGAVSSSAVPESPPPALQDVEQLLIWDSGSKQLLTVPMRDYLIGAVASEMPPDWPEEALKAQVIASHSYALYQRQQTGEEGAERGYFSADPARRQGFMTNEVLKSYWGTAYEKNYQRISALVDEVLHLVLTWEGQPAAACYHAISCGTTEASQNVWSEALPYLQGVSSPLDLTSPDYEKTVSYTTQQMYDALTLSGQGLHPDDLDPEHWFGACQRTPAGNVQTIETAGSSLTGPQLRQILGLRSACFEIHFADGVFAVTTKGYGHGVGLSQYGASAMALTGKSCAEILACYYPGTQLLSC